MWSKCIRLLCLWLGVVLIVASTEMDTEVTKILRHLLIMPDLLDVGPQEFLNVTYLGTIRADRGVELQPMQVRDEPVVKWVASDEDYYTLLLTDPNLPSNISNKSDEYLHWLVVNIPGNNIHMGDVRYGYIGSMPPKTGGLHRYVFLLYKQPDYQKFNIDRVAKHEETNRYLFNTRRFAKRYKLGHPLAGNVFTCAWNLDVLSLQDSLQVQGHRSRLR